MGAKTTIYLVRHAQSHPTNRLDEREWPLSELGQQQAQRLSPLLESLDIDHIVSSPYTRCLDTIRPFADSSGLNIAIDHGLRERRITLKLRKDFEEILARSWEDFSFALPGCESSGAAQRRIRPTIEKIIAEYPGRNVAVCSHGNAISLMLNGLDSRFGLDEMWSLRNPDVVCLTADAGGIRRDNDFDLPGLHQMATPHKESPIEW
jgi:2,3-bisphosphoglycerate-dependent phosphoglycerate mutase